MATKKITCPMCMTKMQSNGHDLVCPVCGYKYCGDHVPYSYDDHDHNQYQSYNQKTTYTSSGNTRPATSSQSTSQSRQNQRYAGTAPNPSHNSSSRNTKKKKKGASTVVWVLITLYVIYIITSAAGEIFEESGKSFSTVIEEFLNSQNTESREPEITIQTSAPENSSIDLTQRAFPDATTEEEASSFLRALAMHIFAKDIEEITLEDCTQLQYLEIYPDDEDSTFITWYLLEDGTENTVSSAFTELYTPDLKAFLSLKGLYIEELSGTKLQPGDLDGLTDLTHLSCTNTPEELRAIIDPLQLESLSIQDWNNTVDLAGISSFAFLRHLSVYAEGISAPFELSNLPYLSFLQLCDDGSLDDFLFLNALEKLETLVLYTPGLTDVSFLENLPLLTSLTLGDCTISDISPIVSCHDLLEVDINYVNGIEDFSPIGSLMSLNTLQAAGCGITELSWTRNLVNLEYLSIVDNPVSSLMPLSEVTTLKQVHCSSEYVEDFGALDPDIIYAY